MTSYSDITRPSADRAMFGTDQELQPAPVPQEAPPARLYVFSMLSHLRGGVPRVFDLPDTEDGRAELVSLIRGERVLAVVRGHRADVQTIDGVEVALGQDTIAASKVVTSPRRYDG